MYSLILLAGGIGSRTYTNIPKQYLLIAGKPIIIHTLDRIDKLTEIDEIVIVCVSQYKELLKNYINTYRLKNKYVFAEAGTTRQESAYNGIKMSTNSDIIIHEAARPFVKESEFKAILADEADNSIFAIPINYTVLMAHENITGLLNRNELINVQLPQKFKKDILLAAHERALAENKKFTEDASMIYHYFKIPIKVLKGTSYNLKITESIDLIIGELIYKEYIIGRS